MSRDDDLEEAERVQALNYYKVLDSEPEPAFERVTKLASEFFDVPVSSISFPIDDRLWFKSIVGLDVNECPRAAGICSHVIESDTPLVLRNAGDDERFHDHPMVAGEPHVRFYAGAPLITPNGQRIGSLCVADIKPRPGFTDAEADRLQELALLIVDELELRLARKNAQRANEAKSAFLAAMSHEIRTPMNGVLGMAELLLTADDINPKHRRRIEIIQRSGETLLTLLDQILDLSKIEADKLEVNTSPFNLRDLIHDIHGLFEPKAQGKNLWLDIRDRLGADHLVIGDPLRIRQILSNFLGNAIKFTEEGGISLTVTLDRRSDKQAIARFEIKDTGIGIEPGAIQRVFSPFEQGDRTTWSKFGGTGLGLAICKKLALLMGGDVGVESEQGKGTTFWLQIDLERQEVDQSSAGPVNQRAHQQTSQASMTPCCDILVAEDEPDMAFLIEDMLEEAGHRVTIASNGASVLKLLEEKTFDMIFMDGRMPDMSGFETTAKIRKLPNDRAKTPVIALTAEAMTGDRERFLSAGMDDYISKPVDYEELIKTIARCSQQPACHEKSTAEAV
ncbi:MAG: ATP-binding protein [Geminicoccales bacterium]